MNNLGANTAVLQAIELLDKEMEATKALSDRLEKRVADLTAKGADMEKITVQWQTDPSHGWLGVTEANVRKVGLSEADFSTYSFKDEKKTGEVVFWLEEDCDAGFFIRACELAGRELRYLPIKNYNLPSPIRKMKRLKGESRLFNSFIKEAEKERATL